MTNVLNIINDVNCMLNIDRQDLFIKCVSERLDQSVKSYYSDIEYKYNFIDNRIDDINLKSLINKI